MTSSLTSLLGYMSLLSVINAIRRYKEFEVCSDQANWWGNLYSSNTVVSSPNQSIPTHTLFYTLSLDPIYIPLDPIIIVKNKI